MTSPSLLDVTVSRLIAATPTELYDVIADIPSMGSFSPETVATRWHGRATEAAVGVRFRGHHRLGALSVVDHSDDHDGRPGPDVRVPGPRPRRPAVDLQLPAHIGGHTGD